jgi:hypothetical protein
MIGPVFFFFAATVWMIQVRSDSGYEFLLIFLIGYFVLENRLTPGQASAINHPAGRSLQGGLR